MNHREITKDVMHELEWAFAIGTRTLAKRAHHRNAEVCAILRSVDHCHVAFSGQVVTVAHMRYGYYRAIDRSLSGTRVLDLSREFKDVIQEVEADSRFGLFLGVEERAG